MAASGTTKFKIPKNILNELCSRFITSQIDDHKKDSNRTYFKVEEAHWYYSDFYVKVQTTGPRLQDLKLKEFALQLLNHCPGFSQYANAKLFEDWQTYKKTVPTYGAIILDPTLEYVLLQSGYTKRGQVNKSWAFPKGKVNQDEPGRQAAVREVYEETGFDISNYIDESNYLDKPAKNDQPSVCLYVIAGVQRSTPFQPKARYEVSKLQWFKIDSLTEENREKHYGINKNQLFMIKDFLRPLQQRIAEMRQSGAYPPPEEEETSLLYTPGERQRTASFMEEEEEDNSFQMEKNQIFPTWMEGNSVVVTPSTAGGKRGNRHGASGQQRAATTGQKGKKQQNQEGAHGQRNITTRRKLADEFQDTPYEKQPLLPDPYPRQSTQMEATGVQQLNPAVQDLLSMRFNRPQPQNMPLLQPQQIPLQQKPVQPQLNPIVQDLLSRPLNPPPHLLNPSQQQLNPSSQHPNPSQQQQLNPSSQHPNPSQQQLNPSSQHPNPSQQQLNPSSQHPNPSQQQLNPSSLHPNPSHQPPNHPPPPPSPPSTRLDPNEFSAACWTNFSFDVNSILAAMAPKQRTAGVGATGLAEVGEGERRGGGRRGGGGRGGGGRGGGAGGEGRRVMLRSGQIVGGQQRV